MSKKVYNPSRVINWFFANGIFLYVLYMATVKEITWAENITMFAIWLFTILYLFAFLATCISEKYEEKVLKKGRSIPTSIDILYDLTIIIILVSHGWFFYGVLWTLTMFFYNALFVKVQRSGNYGKSKSN